MYRGVLPRAIHEDLNPGLSHVEFIGEDYIIDRKPSPAVFAGNAWRPEPARRDLREFIDQALGRSVELIMKDISTVRYDPQRLWEWAEIAMEVAEEYAS